MTDGPVTYRLPSNLRTDAIVAGLVLIVTAFMVSCADTRRAANADGAIRVLEQQTATAQKERHAATLAAINAKQQLATARAHADSLEEAARDAEAKSARLAKLVRVASETSLVVQMTPEAPSYAVSVPRVVVSYIRSLNETIQRKDSALAARDTQMVRADTVIVFQDRIVRADSAVVTTQASTITEEKRARPRLGFGSGVVVAALVALVVHFVR